ncbi:MAG: histidine kinase [Solirubrobacteraceae bacterium]|nr:histidine kinase [Patulibacter sp.]
MVARANALLTQLWAWCRERRWTIDALIVIAIVGLGSVRAPDSLHDLAAWSFTLALALPLMWRTQYPVGVFAGIAAIAAWQWALDVRAFGDAALLVALYTVAAKRPVRVTLAAAAVLEFGIVIAIARWHFDFDPVDMAVALSGLVVAAAVLGVNVQNRQALLASLEERAARLEAERDQQGRLSAAAERARIAREMHDIVAHNLSVMIALADGATYALKDAPDRSEEAMRKASSTGRRALTEMRRLLGVLREDEPGGERTPQPGIDQLDALVDQVRSAGLPTTYRVTGTPPEEPSAGLGLAVYRIVQEALTNALKHGGPGAEATISASWDGPRLDLQITNTGQITPPAGDTGGGLRGMRERAAVYDGTVEAGPLPEGGWQVVATLVQDTADGVAPILRSPAEVRP